MFYKSNILEILNKRIDLEIVKKNTEPETINTGVNFPIIIPINEINHLQRFQQQAAAAYKKSYYSSKKDATFHKYLLCWYNDMKSILKDFGITEQQFFNFIK